MEILTLESFKAKVFDFQSHKDWKYAGDLPAVVDFYADWCGPCRALAPILDEISREYKGKLHVYKVNTETNPELAELFGIRSIPSVLFVPMTGEPAIAAGMAPKAEIKKVIGEVLGITESLIVNE